ncbi:SCO1860 family LAETG-anchored protein [Kitasatospora phosalacinea]|uniref:LPXTG cell wall anchor domain-containing protein n=1 Tax=Kitasatospora phosalacinea TaxID=2065 RepID=A0A9W6PCX3_9ACTN|nr:SCO1860 family LAETG-anchored protein [Kitasatospora phosalacinea]GLW52673.1 LPXTG cell wall anchor domain-containing protein [Kitasatospora phosalacinea]
MSVLRSVAASALVVSALAVGLPVSSASAADAAAGTPAKPGRASAVTAGLSLDVTLLNAVDVPVDVSLNRVESPAQRDGAMLTAKVDGVDGGRPVTLVKAEVGRSVAKADEKLASASVKLVDADVHVPGLPLTTLLGLEAMSAQANCPVDGQPTADVVAPAKLTVLGRSVTVGLNSPTHVDVPAIGSVDVEFAKKTVTSSRAAASALEVKIALNPLNLNVAKVNGTVTVASVSCEKPVAAVAPAAAVSSPPASSPAAPAPASAQNRAVPKAEGQELAYTGSNGTTVLAAGGGTLLVAGGAAVWMTRRRRAAHARHR